MRIIEQIGAYGGLASVVGLAVLAALYFSQARDVKRLREWAGRAPERGGVPGAMPYQQGRVMAQPQRVVPQSIPSPAAAVAQGTAKPGPVRPPAPGQAPPGPATTPPRAPSPPGTAPAPARAAASGAGPHAATGPPAATPATATPAAATPAAARVAAGEERGEEGTSQDTMVHPPPPPGEAERDVEDDADHLEADDPELEAEQAADEDLEEEELDEDAHPEDEGPGDEPEYEDEYDEAEDTGDAPAIPPPFPPPPPRPAILSRPPPMPARLGSQPAQAPILPPYEQSRPGGDQPWYRGGLVSRGGVLVAGATLFVVALIAVALLQLGDEGAEPKREQAVPSAGRGGGDGGGGKSKGRGAVVPARVTVSVLNGTTVGGLAAELGDKLQGQGFRLGNVTNSTDQARAESVVLFAPGAEQEGAEVGRRLKIDQREPIDSESQTLAGDASVVVIAGADLTQ